MESLLQPENSGALDALVATILTTTPSLRIPFLAQLGKTVHASAARALFGTVAIPDEDALFASHASILSPVLERSEQYAAFVKVLEIGTLLHVKEDMRAISEANLTTLIQKCTQLEEFVWTSALPPPDGVCETLSRCCPQLKKFERRAEASHVAKHPNGYSKWNAPSLAMLTVVSITHLTLARLSQTGARMLSSYLQQVGHSSLLESVLLDFVWLDDSLCEDLVNAGRKLSMISLSTTGTKLTDSGVISLMEGCDALKTFVMDDVEGRLSKTLWSKPETYPQGLRHLHFIVSESNTHHSWNTDHLASLSSMPLETLHSLSITRRNALPIHDSKGDFTYLNDSALPVHPITPDALNAIRRATFLETLKCDLWSVSLTDIKAILEACTELQSIQVCLDAPFAKLLGLSTSSSCGQLREIMVTILPEHCQGAAPPLKAHADSEKSLPTEKTDPTTALTRDIKRFVRKCSKLQRIEWYGRAARGSWTIAKSTSTSKLGGNAAIEYRMPSITSESLHDLRTQETLDSQHGSSWLAGGRSGQEWELSDEGSVENVAELATPVRSNTRPIRTERTPSITSTSGSSETSDGTSPRTPTGAQYSPVAIASPLSSSPEGETRQSRYARVRAPSSPTQHKGSPESPNGSKLNSRIRRRSTVDTEGREPPANSGQRAPRRRGGKGRRASVGTPGL